MLFSSIHCGPMLSQAWQAFDFQSKANYNGLVNAITGLFFVSTYFVSKNGYVYPGRI